MTDFFSADDGARAGSPHGHRHQRGARGFGHGPAGFGPTGGPAVWEAMDHLRAAFGAFDRRPGSRRGRGDVRAAVLTLLAEAPMHGYEIIRQIEERSGSSWKPSPGSVYPTLQLLADEGLITADEEAGRKTYALTDSGRAEAELLAEKPAPWQEPGQRDSGRLTALPKAGVELAEVTAQVARIGSPEEVEEAVAILKDAKRKLYTILANSD